MKRRTFYKKLRKIADQFVWKTFGNCIRAERQGYDDEFCPITAVEYAETGVFFNQSDYVYCGERLGLSGIDSRTIAGAADGDTDQKRTCSRNAMIQIVKKYGQRT